MTPNALESLHRRPILFLAPMEGVMDGLMRELVTGIAPNAYDFAVTEFIRITDLVMPTHVFEKYCPELKTESRTPSGTKVLVQLLGGNAEMLAKNAAKACALGAGGIDLNFGCPAPTVNRHDGGATLLKYPDRLGDIVSQVRAAVPTEISVSAKIRLGFDDPSVCLENARRLQDAGASWITVHCRTRTDGYKPPAHWEWIPRLREVLHVPLIVNGEIWSREDLFKCQAETKESAYMIGRGSLSSPLLGGEIRAGVPVTTAERLDRMAELLEIYAERCFSTFGNSKTCKRLKQWIRFMSMRHPQFEKVFQEIKTLEHQHDILRTMKSVLLKEATHGSEN